MRIGPDILAVVCCGLAAFAQAPAQTPPVQAPPKTNQDSLILQDFSRRVAEYVKLHKAALAEVHKLKPTGSAEAIERFEHRLAHKIREARTNAVQGGIFTPEIAAEFRRLIGLTMKGDEAVRIHESLLRAAPVHLHTLRVNIAYPKGIPLQSTPPSLLANLPPLPPEVEYRIVGRNLVLRDTEANLIIDFMTNAIL